MKYLKGFICTAIAGTLMVGCTTTKTSPGLIDSSRTAHGSTPSFQQHGTGLSDAVPLSPSDIPDGGLTFGKATALALGWSPSMEAFKREQLRSEAMLRQAGIWSNPELEVEWEDIDSVEGSALETQITISQRIPIGGDIARRRALAAARVDKLNWEFEAARVETLMRVSERFVHALSADKRVELATRELELAEGTREVIRRQVEAGKSSPVELMRIEVSVINAELALDSHKRLRDSSYRQLSLCWTTGQPVFDKVVGDLEWITAPPDASLLVESINSNPEIARWSAVISERVAERRLAVAAVIPDPSIRVGTLKRDQPDEEGVIVGISFPIPVFDRKQGDLIAVREGQKAALAQKRSAELRVEGLLDRAYTGLVNAYHEAMALRERAIPAAESSFQAIQTSFTEGKLGYLDVLDSQSELFELEGRYLDSLVKFHLNALGIEALTGQPLVELPADRGELIN